MRLLLLLLSLTGFSLAQTNPPRGDIRTVVLSDFNPSYGESVYSLQVARVIEATTEVWRPDLFLMAGDLVGGQKQSLPDERFAQMWAAFDDTVAAPLRAANIPHAAAIGNHDGSSLRTADETYLFNRERDAARDYWQQTQAETQVEFRDEADFPFNYSFTFERVFFVVWDASSATITDAQTTWLQAEFASQKAQAAPLRVLVGHLPLYGVSTEKNEPGEVLTGGDALRQRLESLGVDLYISGHHAAYYPAKVGDLTLLNTGGVGARRLLGSDAPPRSAVTVLDIGLEPLELRLTTFDTATFQEIPLASLPERIDGLNGTLTRIDLAP
ncbi:metallophosphoesterase [soil metagenome]